MTTKALIHLTSRPAIASEGCCRDVKSSTCEQIDILMSIFAMGHPESTPRSSLTE
jgi:hypothetical protein